MRLLSSVLAALALAPLSAMAAKEVFAQYLVGVTDGQVRSDWDSDIKLAKATNIDGFALTIRSADSWTAAQLALAYESAEANDFSVYITFDMTCGCGEWSVAQIVNYINSTKNHPAQFKVDGRPMVSTVDGYDFLYKWADVRAGAGGLFFAPSWSDLGTLMWDFAALVDGAASTLAWTGMTGEDYGLMSALQGRPYMMPVSPWFYTNALKSTKNYNFKSDILWHQRWEQVLGAAPNFVQIISWNDYASSNYIGPIRAQGVTQAGAGVYVDSTHSHDGWRMILPYYIKAFKAGARSITVDTEGASFWYRTTSKSTCSNGGTSCAPPSANGKGAGEKCVNDSIYVVTALKQAKTLSVSVGTGKVGARIQAAAGVNFYEVPFTGGEGAVTISLDGKAAPAGPPITNNCPASGHVNFNAYAGQFLL